MTDYLYIPEYTPLENAEHLAKVAWERMQATRKRAHRPEHRDEWSMGLALAYRFALMGALAMRRQLRPPRITRRHLVVVGNAWDQRPDGTLIRREPERFTPEWIEQHREPSRPAGCSYVDTQGRRCGGSHSLATHEQAQRYAHAAGTLRSEQDSGSL